MQVDEVRPRSMIPSPPAEQCQAYTNQYRSGWDERKFAERGWDLKKCSNGVSVKIDGVGYCRQHGGKVALEKLISMGRVVEVANAVEE
jgi:hypothetical protein